MQLVKRNARQLYTDVHGTPELTKSVVTSGIESEHRVALFKGVI